MRFTIFLPIITAKTTKTENSHSILTLLSFLYTIFSTGYGILTESTFIIVS